MTATKHDLAEYSIYECVLMNADKKLEAIVGVELPFLAAWSADMLGDCDEDEDKRLIHISFEDEYLDQSISGQFQIGENILKGIANGRHEDHRDFVNSFLPIFRPGYVQAVLRHELQLFESEWFEDQRLINKFDAYDVFQGFGTIPWEISDLTVQGVAVDLFRVEFVFQNEAFQQYEGQQVLPGESIEYDRLLLPVALTWDEFTSVTKTLENLINWLKQVHRDFIVRREDLKGHYSEEAKRHIDYLEAINEGDEERLAEDSFTTGELVFDEDGRAHFASDVEK